MKAIPQWAQEVFDQFETQQAPCQFDDERGPTEIVGDEIEQEFNTLWECR